MFLVPREEDRRELSLGKTKPSWGSLAMATFKAGQYPTMADLEDDRKLELVLLARRKDDPKKG